MKQREKVERALRSIASEGFEGEQALAILFEDGCRVLRLYLRRRCSNVEDVEEIIQTIFSRVASIRTEKRFDHSAAWYAYLYVAASNAARDLKNVLEGELVGDVADPRDNAYETLCRVLDRHRLLDWADQTWLGREPEQAKIRCLAAQYYYVEGRSWETVAQLVAVYFPPVHLKTQTDLENWLGDIWVLRKAVFEALYLSEDRLLSILLGSQRLTSPEIDLLVTRVWRGDQESGFGGWSWAELKYLLLRYRSGDPPSHALARASVPLTNEQISDIDARCQALFPFVKTMKGIWQRLDHHPLRGEALAKNLLWKRLVFQYHLVENLPQNDILLRVSGPAAVTGYLVNNINSWIATRLAEDIRRHMMGASK